ncbi:MAG: TIGR00730 family Rossman fold protein [Pirellulales bacterium]|nr:TIGR00730 family Rossman fold protein [Pirellulales bacterium]
MNSRANQRSGDQSTVPPIQPETEVPRELGGDQGWQSTDLIEQIKETADKLAKDQASRGDLKIVSRALRELRYAFKVFSEYRQQRKVSVFGSARTLPEAAAYEQAIRFGRAMARQDWYVVTGAANGIMEAGHRGAGREHSMGVNIMLPFEQDANPVIAGDPKLVHMKYFFTRKLMFVKECDAVCLLPGGFGTLDEGLEVLTLLQTGKRDLCPVVFLDAEGGDFWESFQELVDNLLKRGMIAEEDLALYIVTDDMQEAVDEILQFYHNYHSMRYVRDKLVLRLQRAPSEEFLEKLNEEFADVLVDGQIESSRALGDERDQPDLMDMPRLVMHFNRRNLGRLRQLVDSLNHGSIRVRKRSMPANS